MAQDPAIAKSSTLRRLLRAVLPTDSEFDSFCLDYFGSTEKMFTSGMDADQKINLLLKREDPAAIVATLREHSPERLRQHEHLLVSPPEPTQRDDAPPAASPPERAPASATRPTPAPAAAGYPDRSAGGAAAEPESDVLRLIARAKAEGWTELDLSGQYLTSLPPELGELRQLRRLNLGWNERTSRQNYLRELPDWMARLTNLQSLDLRFNELKVLPDRLAKLTNLQSLDLSSNGLTELPGWLAELTSLQSLDLSANRLTELPGWLAELTNLQSLNLRSYRLKELPDWLAKLTSLKSLHLSSNGLTELPDWLAKLSNLSLDLRANKLKGLPGRLAKLTNLQSLDLSSNELGRLPDWLAKLTNLQSLDLSSNNLTELPDSLARLTNLQSLDLGFNRLTELPDSLARLTSLQSLDLGFNRLTELPDWLAKLTNLQSLDLNSNQLTELPDWLARLTNLQSLDISFNRLTELPDWLVKLTNLRSLDISSEVQKELPGWLAKLTNLRSLHLSSNGLIELPDWLAKLTSLSLDIRSNGLKEVPNWLAKLTNLQSLDLRSNRLTELPDWLAKLTNLQSLDLSSNGLTELPDWLAKLTNLQYFNLRSNNLKELPDWLAAPQNLPQLRYLYIGENPLSVPPLEVLDEAVRSYSWADIDAIRSYFRQLNESKSVYVYEAKLLIIGEGGAGKTSLARKLKEPSCKLLPSDKSTEGIDIITWNFPVPPELIKGTSGDQYTARIWDFGGQEIYFATHQFFLTKRSVYLLVADTRLQHTDFYTWLLMQETFGADSPVLLVKNRNRRHGNQFTIANMAQLRERFPNLQEPIEVDLNDAPSDPGWRKLIQTVQEHLLNLPHIKQPRPGSWVAVRQAIRDRRDSIIKWADFAAICRDNGMKHDADIAQLADYMHNLGDILYFHEDPLLRRYVIIKPTWGLDAVYKVLDNKKIADNLGRFRFGDLQDLWDNPIYKDYQFELLQLMKNFQLCYEIPNQKNIYISPQLLGEVQPRYLWEPSDNLQLRYDYPVFMPRGILSRAIVVLHRYIEKQTLVWRSGVILHDEYARAEVLELRGEGQIRIRVSGRNKRDLLMQIVRALNELHKGFPKLKFDRLVPCNCERCKSHLEPHFFGFDALLTRLANQAATIECQQPPYRNVQIHGLLSDIGLLELPEELAWQVPLDEALVFYQTKRFDVAAKLSHLPRRSAAVEQPAALAREVPDSAELAARDAAELEKLTQQKTAIERPIQTRARAVKYAYIGIYLASIPLIWIFLQWLIALYKGWNEFEPIAWAASMVFAAMGPLLYWISPEKLRPAAIEKNLIARWRADSFAKYGFDSARYQELLRARTEPRPGRDDPA